MKNKKSGRLELASACGLTMEYPVVTLREVASQAGVSVITASRILNGQTKGLRRDATLRASKVLKVARKLGYQPNASARAMRNNRSPHIGVLIRYAPDFRFHHLAKFETILGINQQLTAAGYVVSIVKMSDVGTTDENTSRVFKERILEGLIVMDPLPDELLERAERLLPNRCIWSDITPGPEHCITRDEFDAGRTAAQRLIDLGYRKITYVGDGTTSAPVMHYSAIDRLAGARRACQTAGIKLETLDTRDPQMLGIDRQVYAVNNAIGLFHKEMGILTYDVTWARWITHLAGSVRKSAPYDFGLVTADDNYDVAANWPGLCRYSISRYELGLQAAEMLMGLLEHPTQRCPSRVLRGQWVPGNTAWGPGAPCEM